MKITDDVVREIEEAVGMGHGAWDTVDPKEIVKAVMETTLDIVDAEAKDIAVNLLVEFQKWENKVAMDTPMQLETDEEDIALMFLEMGEIGSDALGNPSP